MASIRTVIPLSLGRHGKIDCIDQDCVTGVPVRQITRKRSENTKRTGHKGGPMSTPLTAAAMTNPRYTNNHSGITDARSSSREQPRCLEGGIR
jgi:hypothetical protein